MTQRETDIRQADLLWADYARNRDPRTRDALVQQFERLAYSIANRFVRPGTDSEDLFQVARIGLVKAVDRFDPRTRNRFSTFATPTITGELMRYFRDQSRPVHVPRGMQELATRATRAQRALTARLGRPAAAGEVAAELELPEAQVVEALALEETIRPLSLEASSEMDEHSGDLLQYLGADDAGLNRAEMRVGVQQALRHLSEPLRQVIQLRYLAELSQRAVAQQLGLSQMQVSRLERRALGELRSQFAVH